MRPPKQEFGNAGKPSEPEKAIKSRLWDKRMRTRGPMHKSRTCHFLSAHVRRRWKLHGGEANIYKQNKGGHRAPQGAGNKHYTWFMIQHLLFQPLQKEVVQTLSKRNQAKKQKQQQRTPQNGDLILAVLDHPKLQANFHDDQYPRIKLSPHACRGRHHLTIISCTQWRSFGTSTSGWIHKQDVPWHVENDIWCMFHVSWKEFECVIFCADERCAFMLRTIRPLVTKHCILPSYSHYQSLSISQANSS